MQQLLNACKGDEKSIDQIIKARATLVDFYIGTVKMAIAMKHKEDEVISPVSEDAKNAIRVLNKVCANKKIKPVYTGNISDTKKIFEFAQTITNEIVEKIK